MDKNIGSWHEFVKTKNVAILGELFADDIKFHSPFIWKPKIGKEMAIIILSSVTEVFEDFRYIREVNEGNEYVLEFEAKIGVLTLRGVDLITFNNDGKIIDFEVMIRPMNALQILGMEMGKRLEAKGLPAA